MLKLLNMKVFLLTDRTTTNNGQTMAAELDVTLPRAFSTPQAPHYPNETAGKLSQQRIRYDPNRESLVKNAKGIQICQIFITEDHVINLGCVIGSDKK